MKVKQLFYCDFQYVYISQSSLYKSLTNYNNNLGKMLKTEHKIEKPHFMLEYFHQMCLLVSQMLSTLSLVWPWWKTEAGFLFVCFLRT